MTVWVGGFKEGGVGVNDGQWVVNWLWVGVLWVGVVEDLMDCGRWNG